MDKIGKKTGEKKGKKMGRGKKMKLEKKRYFLNLYFVLEFLKKYYLETPSIFRHLKGGLTANQKVCTLGTDSND